MLDIHVLNNVMNKKSKLFFLDAISFTFKQKLLVFELFYVVHSCFPIIFPVLCT